MLIPFAASLLFKPASLFLVLTLGQAVTAVGPEYPPEAVNGGAVVAILHVSQGAIASVDIVQGDEPFIAGTKTALGSWRFKPTDSGEALVVVSYRSPTLYSTGSASRDLTPGRSPAGLAYPRRIVEPDYPPTSLASGSVVMRLEVAANGTVGKASPVQSVSGLSDACAAAVQKWQFVPAVGVKGNNVASEAYAVFVVRQPVLAPVKKHL